MHHLAPFICANLVSCTQSDALENLSGARSCPTLVLMVFPPQMCLSCRCWGHTLKTCPSAPLGKSCYNCGQDGHRLSDCPEPRVDGENGSCSSLHTNGLHDFTAGLAVVGRWSRPCRLLCVPPQGPPQPQLPFQPQRMLSEGKAALVTGCGGKGGTDSLTWLQGGCCKLCGGVTHLAKDCVTPRGGGGGGGRGGGGAKLRTICMCTPTLPQVWNEGLDAQWWQALEWLQRGKQLPCLRQAPPRGASFLKVGMIWKTTSKDPRGQESRVAAQGRRGVEIRRMCVM